MPRLRLTDKFVHSVHATGARQEYLDALVPQLMLRVGEGGAKTWALLARYPGFNNPTRRSLGPVFAGSRPPGADPDVFDRPGAALTLAEAREKARRWLDLIARRIDPAAQKKAQAVAAEEKAKAAELATRSTFGAVAEEWFRRKASELKKGLEAERLVRREFIPRWQDRPLAAITPKDVSSAIRSIVDRHSGQTSTGRPAGTFQAFAAFGYLRQIFNFAIGAGEYDITASPIAALSQTAILGDKTSRDRVLDDTEVRAVWAAALELDYPWGDTIRLLVITGQRLREIADLNWSEIDLEQKRITIPGKRMKGDRAHEIPLAPMALGLLEALPRWAEGRGFVFSTTGGIRPIAGFGRTKRRLDEISKVENWVLHDLRRTMRTRLSALPIEDRVREAMIAHAAPGLHQVYDQHRYFDEKRRGFELWEGKLLQILEGNVIRLRGAQ